MTKKAKYGEEEVEFIRLANPNDPGFDPGQSKPQALVRDGDGKKHVVFAEDLYLSAGAAMEEAAPTTVKQGPPPQGKQRRRG